MKAGLNCHLIAIVLVLTLPLAASAAGPSENGPVLGQLKKNSVSLGLVNSFRGVGVCIEVGTVDFHSFSAGADLLDIISGKSSAPGFKCTYHYNLSILEGSTSEGYPYKLYAGPGTAFGYVRGLDNKLGLMAGVSCAAGARITLRHNISIYIEFQGDAALIFKNRYNQRMSLYSAGLRYSHIPYLRIAYNFR